MKKTNIFASVVAGILVAGNVGAATDSDTFEVRVQVADSCEISANDLDFGTYDVLTTIPLLNTTTIDVTCSLLTGYSVGIDQGINGSSVTDRKMIIDGIGTETLNYTLGCIGIPACVLNWGDIGSGSELSGIGTGLTQSLTVNGTIAISQVVPVGSYRDNPVTATIEF